jgi:hypothetical protein
MQTEHRLDSFAAMTLVSGFWVAALSRDKGAQRNHEGTTEQHWDKNGVFDRGSPLTLLRGNAVQSLGSLLPRLSPVSGNCRIYSLVLSVGGRLPADFDPGG